VDGLKTGTPIGFADVDQYAIDVEN